MKEFEGLKIPDGDILFLLETGTLGIRKCDINIPCDSWGCSKCLIYNPIALAKYIATYLTPIDQIYVPFGMLSEEKQRELRKATKKTGALQGWKWSLDKFTNMEYAVWGKADVYRLDPDWTPEDPKEERKKALIKELEELGAVVDGKVIL